MTAACCAACGAPVRPSHRPPATPIVLRAARHEAGHAVMAIASGLPVLELTIAPERLLHRPADGRCWVELPARPPQARVRSLEDRDELERYAGFLLAGEAGELLLSSLPEDARAGARRDYEQLEALLELWPEPLRAAERAALVDWWRVRTLHALERRWAALFTIASELLLTDSQTLLGDEVLALYTDAIGPPSPPLSLRSLTLPPPHPLTPTSS